MHSLRNSQNAPATQLQIGCDALRRWCCQCCARCGPLVRPGLQARPPCAVTQSLVVHCRGRTDAKYIHTARRCDEHAAAAKPGTVPPAGAAHLRLPAPSWLCFLPRCSAVTSAAAAVMGRAAAGAGPAAAAPPGCAGTIPRLRQAHWLAGWLKSAGWLKNFWKQGHTCASPGPASGGSAAQHNAEAACFRTGPDAAGPPSAAQPPPQAALAGHLIVCGRATLRCCLCTGCGIFIVCGCATLCR